MADKSEEFKKLEKWLADRTKENYELLEAIQGAIQLLKNAKSFVITMESKAIVPKYGFSDEIQAFIKKWEVK